MLERAGRSVVDRFLGMEEAAGSIPARSIRLFFFVALVKRGDIVWLVFYAKNR